MKQILTTSILLGLPLAFSQVAQAHPGHDHSHWTSEPIHILTMVAIGTVIVGGLAYKHMTRRKNLKQKEMNHDA
ncbi:hypothetical protein [Marinomonas transparens]|uniref:Cobalt transport protein CbiN n=1 Tax=Marinomonas transparens TaxID=2795388 RepID=A0A934JTJ3_9GAMM|nr:hypothetical protein [Marinomonas transparens]MBJ7539699.1 hypothetical protein [Marinomonas transparens]